MKIKLKKSTKEFEFFTYDELSKEAQDRAMNDLINFWIDCLDCNNGSDNFRKAIDKSNSMQTPWFVGEYIYEYCKDELLSEMKLNNDLFYEDGSSVPIIYHTKDNKIIKTVYKVGGREIELDYLPNN